jgi:hypothetical protein
MTLRAIVMLSLVAALSVAACSDNGRTSLRDPPAGPTPVPEPSDVRVDYRVTGTHVRNVHITYFSSSQGTTQVTTDLPWSITYRTPDLHPFVYLQADTPIDQNDEGTLVVQIFVNGLLFREAHATGFELEVAASGDVP